MSKQVKLTQAEREEIEFAANKYGYRYLFGFTRKKRVAFICDTATNDVIAFSADEAKDAWRAFGCLLGETP